MEALLFITLISLIVIGNAKLMARKVFLISLCYNLFWMILYELDLLHLGRTVYWSDAEFYLNGSNREFYTTFSYSWFIKNLAFAGFSPLFIRVLMVWIISLVHAIFFDLFKIRKLGVSYLLLVLLNPFLTLPITRLMKDGYFLLFLAITFKILDSRSFFKYIWLTGMFFVLPSIRPWSLFLPILFGVILILEKERFRVLKIVLGLSLVFPLIISQKEILIIWYKFIVEGKLSSYNLDTINRFLGVPRLLFSPGFYRLVYPENYFIYYMTSLLSAVGLGLLCNYFLITNTSVYYVLRELKKSPVLKYVYIYILLAIFIYSFAYSGSVEFRIKASIWFPLIYVMYKSMKWEYRNYGLGLLKFFVLVVFFSVYAA